VSRVLIIGVGGQDGSYLAEYLSNEGETQVFGLLRRSDHPRAAMLRALPRVHLVLGDLLDTTSIMRALRLCRPDTVYNTAAVLAPRARWIDKAPPLMLETTGLGPARLLEALTAMPETRLVHVSSSAIYQPEKYAAYGVAKKLAHDAVVGYRNHADVWASNAIFFSHTSPRQDDNFLIRQLVRAVVQISRGGSTDLRITNLANRRDWGWSPDFVRALVKIARADEPGDFVVRSGVTHNVRDILSTAAKFVGVSPHELLNHWPEAERIPNEQEPAPAVNVPDWRHETRFAEMIKKLVEFEVRQHEA
jgi:GDPmannose 4,6-dehydratase